jgi:DNA-binding MarR family transcriptional regulator
VAQCEKAFHIYSAFWEKSSKYRDERFARLRPPAPFIIPFDAREFARPSLAAALKEGMVHPKRPHANDDQRDDGPRFTPGLRLIDDTDAGGSDRPSQLLKRARLILARRQARLRFFNPAMFGEPAWDILLQLYVSQGLGARQTVTSLAQTAGAPASSAIRWLHYLEKERLIERRPHPNDRRIIFIQLTQKATGELEQYLADDCRSDPPDTEPRS